MQFSVQYLTEWTYYLFKHMLLIDTEADLFSEKNVYIDSSWKMLFEFSTMIIEMDLGMHIGGINVHY